jgi:hypothetical protein
MKILLDTKDLIDLLEREQPVRLAELRDWLLARNSTIVLTFGNVRELAAPLANGGDAIHVSYLFQRLASLPISYFGEVKMLAAEARSAVRAFNSGIEYRTIDPYVSRWDETMVESLPASTRMLIRRLDEIVLLAACEYPTVFGGFGFYEESLRKQFADDRRLSPSARVPEDNFPKVLSRLLAHHEIEQPTGTVVDFASWVHADARRCPALRLGHEVYNEIVKNINDIPESGDIPDMALIRVIPYVDAVTLDRRMRGYCSQVCQKLQKALPAINYVNRIFANLQELIAAKS